MLIPGLHISSALTIEGVALFGLAVAGFLIAGRWFNLGPFDAHDGTLGSEGGAGEPPSQRREKAQHNSRPRRAA